MKPVRLTLIFALAALSALSGCASPPPPIAPELDFVPPPSWSAAITDTADVTSRWWQTFDDPMLDSLIVEAVHANTNVAVAAARVDATLAQARIAGADKYPTLGAGLSARRQQQNFVGLPVPGGDVLTSTSTGFGLSLDTTWEVDLWGRLRAREAAAMAEVQASRAAFEGVLLSVSGLVAKAWFAAVEARLQVELADATVESFATSAEQVRRRYSLGVRTSLDLRLALTQLAGSQALLELRRQQYDLARRQLEVLLNRYPAGLLEPGVDLPAPPESVPGGLPADLISRRPDLVVAERRLAASDRRWAEAKRSLYPRISLTASAGTSTAEFSDLLSGSFGVWSLVGNVLQPIFQGGKLRANVALNEALTDQAIAGFAGAVLTAYAEVESALAAEGFLRARETALIDAVAQASAGEQVAQEQYRAGVIDFITLQQSQRDALDARSSLLEVRRARLTNRIDLFLALGGGFVASEVYPLEPVTQDALTEDQTP